MKIIKLIEENKYKIDQILEGHNAINFTEKNLFLKDLSIFSSILFIK